jgi:hypothetical protein
VLFLSHTLHSRHAVLYSSYVGYRLHREELTNSRLYHMARQMSAAQNSSCRVMSCHVVPCRGRPRSFFFFSSFRYHIFFVTRQPLAFRSCRVISSPPYSVQGSILFFSVLPCSFAPPSQFIIVNRHPHVAQVTRNPCHGEAVSRIQGQGGD